MFDFNQFSFAYGKPQNSGTLKASAQDFKVNEVLGFDLTGEGEHQFLLIEKKGLNTEELIKALARSLGKSEKTISYAGLKDRQALTTQWIGIHCPGEEIIGVDTLQGDGWRVLEAKRHLKKLKIGGLAANDFIITLRDIEPNEVLEERLAMIKTCGVPNYFGPQRFGFQGQNLVKAKSVLLDGLKIKNKFLRGIYYSAARSFLFNRILSERVKAANWNQALIGDLMQLAGKNSIFPIDQVDEQIQTRITDFDLSPAAPLWGKGEERVRGDALHFQELGLKDYESWCLGLEKQGLERAYRALILAVENLSWIWQDNSLLLQFRLRAGSYATSVIRELIATDEAVSSRQKNQ